MTLTEFLLARLAEDEEQIRDHVSFFGVEGSMPGWAERGRLLADCEAKRQIVELAQYVDDAEGGGAAIALFDGYRAIHPGRAAKPGVLPALAAVYADHPDYRDEWRP